MNRSVIVQKVIQSRNGSVARPASWDERRPGYDTIIDQSGAQVVLMSSGQQSTPEVGWTIILTEPAEEGSWKWTLYGMPLAG